MKTEIRKHNKINGIKGIVFLMFLFIPLFIYAFFPGTFSFSEKGERENYNAPVKRKILVAGDVNYPPYEYVDKDKSFKGFNVDCISAIAKASNLDIEIIPMTWSDAIQALKRGDVQVIQGMTISEERKKDFLFSDAIITNSQAIFVNKERYDIQSMGDLMGKKVVCQKGDISKSIIDVYEDIEAIEVQDQQTAVIYLDHKKADAFIGNRITGIYTMQKMSYTNQVKIVGSPLYESAYSVAVGKSDVELLGIINMGLKKIKADGTYDRLYAKWFSDQLYDRSQEFVRVLVILSIILVISMGIILVFFIWNKALKREVGKATYSININMREKDAIIESIESGIITFSSDGIITSANSFAKKLIAVDELVGQSYKDTKLPGLLGVDFFDMNKNDIYFRKNYEWKIDGEESCYVDVTFIPIEAGEESEDVDGYILHLHDYTNDRKMTIILQQKDKMAALGQLSAGVAHEVRNPLTAIKTFIELMPNKIDNPDFRANLLSILPSEIQRLESLTSKLLDYSKPRNTEATKVDVNIILEEIYTLMKLNLRERDIEFTIPEEKVEIIADSHHIKQILINLITNSIDAIGNHGYIKIKAKKMKELCEIVIEDSGCGIAEEHLDRVFDPFFTMKEKGSGIGLAITEQLVLENGGKIEVESKVGKGTTMTLTFRRKV